MFPKNLSVDVCIALLKLGTEIDWSFLDFVEDEAERINSIRLELGLHFTGDDSVNIFKNYTLTQVLQFDSRYRRMRKKKPRTKRTLQNDVGVDKEVQPLNPGSRPQRFRGKDVYEYFKKTYAQTYLPGLAGLGMAYQEGEFSIKASMAKTEGQLNSEARDRRLNPGALQLLSEGLIKINKGE